MDTIIYLSKGQYDGEAQVYYAPFLSRGDAMQEGRLYDRSEIVEVVVQTGAPAGYVRDHNGHAPWTYIREDGMVLGVYPPYDADHPAWGADESYAWYVVGRDGEEPIYEGSHPAIAYTVAATAPMGETI